MKNLLLYILIVGIVTSISCSGEDPDPTATIDIISATINGTNINEPDLILQREVNVVFVFSSAVDPGAMESAFTVTGGAPPVSIDFTYGNATTKVTAAMTLAYDTRYSVSISTAPIGVNGEKLALAQNFSFTTTADDVIRSMAPCTNLGDCLRSIELPGSQANGTFEFYSNYPIYEESAEWENLTHAVIVVHGASHNPDDYFSYMTNTLEDENVSGNTILIAPYFRSNATGSADDYYWASTNWRRGRNSTNTNKISSFEVVDRLIDQLANTERFPVLEKIIVTGHSSGAAFTHVYAGANNAENTHTTLDFEYVVANSQFLYYPDDRRINEANNELYTPTGCTAYNIWPLGYNATPPYLAGIAADTYNAQFANRSITYLLGNGNQSDPTLNTTDCENTLQGSSRYQRGENMFRYMNLVYPNVNGHARAIVSGIGHNGQGMYQSTEFKSLLNQLLQ
jgi:hypothetical protein